MKGILNCRFDIGAFQDLSILEKPFLNFEIRLWIISHPKLTDCIEIVSNFPYDKSIWFIN